MKKVHLNVKKIQVKSCTAELEYSMTEEIKHHAGQLKLYFGNQKNFFDEMGCFYQYLSHPEISRSKRFFKKTDERTYVISHALINKKISEILGLDFNKLKINYFDNKKPYIEQSNLDFNLSHSFDNFAFAISTYEDMFVGIDIEEIRFNLDIEPIVCNYFHENEINYILNSNADNLIKHQRFYEVWTRKEAFFKMLGIGLSEKLPEIDMSPGEHEIRLQDNSPFNNTYFSNIFIYTLLLPESQVLSLSTNRPVIILPESCEAF